MGNAAAILDFVQQRIRALTGLESVSLADDGAINVIISNGIDRKLREDVLEIGKRALVPVRVFYRMPDGRAIGEGQLRQEGIEDYYTPIHVPGFLGDKEVATPDEVATDVKGAEKLKRVRGVTRGRPVVAWKVGNASVRRGCEVAFKKAMSLQWTMGRTINVEKGVKGKVVDISSRRPIAYLEVGNYDGVELPIHMLGHAFELVTRPVKESSDYSEYLGYQGIPESNRLLYIGFDKAARSVGKRNRKPGENDPYYRVSGVPSPAVEPWRSADVTSEKDEEDALLDPKEFKKGEGGSKGHGKEKKLLLQRKHLVKR